MRILVVEDDAILADAIRVGLRQHGFTVDAVHDGLAASHALAPDHAYAAAVLDLGLPRRDGLEVLARLRATGDAVPVLILTARDAVDDRIQGLDAGADDYLIKPFALGELAARLRALARRGAAATTNALRHAALSLDPVHREVTWQGRPIELSAKEFAVLHCLLRHAGRVVSRQRIEDDIYAWGEEIESNAVEVHIHHLRRKIAPELIRTVRGAGYRLTDTQVG